jgi:hypothetical protein
MAWTLDFEQAELKGALPASCKVCPEAAATGKQGLLMTGKGPFFAAYKVPVEPGKRDRPACPSSQRLGCRPEGS